MSNAYWRLDELYDGGLQLVKYVVDRDFANAPANPLALAMGSVKSLNFFA